MTTRNTPPPPPYEVWRSEDLLEELGVALRDMVLWSASLPDDLRARQHLRRVHEVHAELAKREVDVAPMLEELTQQTAWLMAQFLGECLAYTLDETHGVPRIESALHVRDVDGIRHWFRCPRCREHEIPDKKGIWLCDACLDAVEASLAAAYHVAGAFVFRSYSTDKWCAHADAETVLIAFEEYDGVGPCFCVRCFVEERQRRATGALSASGPAA